ncbi:hypothetical protein [Kineococcus sp. SYSU DK005]|uniref:hypothetical protein n=1 Tax=Kineococcus sp. SYSU DK005 TaxID=3383126 RepID=UPI003D7E204C
MEHHHQLTVTSVVEDAHGRMDTRAAAAIAHAALRRRADQQHLLIRGPAHEDVEVLLGARRVRVTVTAEVTPAGETTPEHETAPEHHKSDRQ